MKHMCIFHNGRAFYVNYFECFWFIDTYIVYFFFQNVAKLVSDIISQIINSEKLLSSAEIAQNISAPVQGTQHSVVKNIDEPNDLDAGHIDKVSKVACKSIKQNR